MEGTRLTSRAPLAFGAGMASVLAVVSLVAHAPFETRTTLLRAIGVSASRTVQDYVLLGVALAMAAVLAWLLRRHARRAAPPQLAPYLMVIAWLCALVAAGFGPMNREHYFDVGDNFHYYLGAKYARELGYDKHYECVATALEEKGRNLPKRYRDLRDNDVQSLDEALDGGAREACRALFERDRWKEFRRDVRRFRNWQEFKDLERRFRDHGYNGTPVWTVVSGTITNALPLSTGVQTSLGLLNLLFITGALTLVLYAFGWELGLCYAVLFWTQYADRYLLSGALLRYLPISVLLTACALLKLGRARAAGACFGLAAGLLVFPSLFLVAAGLYLAIQLVMVRGDLRALSGDARRAFDLVWTGGLTFVALCGLAAAYHGGFEIFGAFLDKMATNSGRLADGRIGLLFNFLWLGEGASPARWITGLALLAALAFSYRRADVLTFVVLIGFTLFFVAFPTVRYYYTGWVALPLALHAAPSSSGSRGTLLALFLLSALCFALAPHVSHALIHNTLLTGGLTAVLIALAVPRVARALGGGVPGPAFGSSKFTLSS
jgi:hypothetical protein